MMTPNIDVEELARHIAARMAPDALLTAEDVGAILNCSARYVREKFADIPDFPRAVRFKLTDSSLSQPRWKRHEIEKYISDCAMTDEQLRGPRRGKPRKTYSSLSF